MSQDNSQPAQPTKRTLFKTVLAAGAAGAAGWFAGKQQGETACRAGCACGEDGFEQGAFGGLGGL